MNARTVTRDLIDVLDRASVPYEVIEHPPTFTARAEARVLGIEPAEVAKTVVLTTPSGFVRAVVPASCRVDLGKARVALGTDDVVLASEEALAGAYPSFELGAVPPLPDASGDAVLVDRRLAERETVVLELGTHGTSARLRTADLVQLSGALLVDLCRA